LNQQKLEAISHLNALILGFSIMFYEILLVRLLAIVIRDDILFLVVGFGIFLLSFGALLSNLLKKFPLYLANMLSITLMVLGFVYLREIKLLVGLSSIPFILFGASIAEIYRKSPLYKYTYAFEVLGACIGTLSTILILEFFNPLFSILIINLVLVVGEFIRNFSKSFYIKLGIVLFILGCLHRVDIDISIVKQGDTPLGKYLKKEKEARILKTCWSYFSRLDLVENKAIPFIKEIFINGATQATVLSKDGIDFIKGGPLTYIYDACVPNNKVLIIGAGGGIDINAALIYNPIKIIACEINKELIKIVKELKNFTGDIYQNPGVKLFLVDGRYFLENTSEKFDKIVLPLASSNALYGTSSETMWENYLYTEEALKTYFKHLTQNGKLVIIFDTRDLIDRLIFNFVYYSNSSSKSLQRFACIVNPDETSMYKFIFIAKKTAFSKNEIDRLLLATHNYNYEIFYVPGLPLPTRWGKLLQGYPIKELKKHFEQEGFNTKNVTDELPFFFDTQHNLKYNLLTAFLVSLFIILAFSYVAILLTKRKHKINMEALIYSGIAGTGFIISELFLTKTFNVLFSNYIFSASLSIVSILVSSFLGALIFVERESSSNKRILLKLKIICFVLGGILIIYALTFPVIKPGLIKYSYSVKILIVILASSVVGFLCGGIFPNILTLFFKKRESVNFAYFINASASACGSFLFMLIVLSYGYSVSALLAGAFYISLALFFLISSHKLSIS